jgi:hypothetical protein
MKKFSLFVAFALAISLATFAQEYRGTISGAVTDPTGAVIAGAKVTVTEINTGTKVDTVSENSGQYNAPFLAPGEYSIAVKMAGFKEFVRKGVNVGAGEHPVIDIRLDVGDASQSVEVTADAGILNTENASAGQAITTKEVEDLPLNGGTPMALASLSLGVIGTGQPGLIHPFDSGGAAGWAVGGGYAQTSELLVDGSPNATWDGRLAYSLPKDAVQEVRVKAFDADASYGHTGGGTLNQIMKTGTNSLHGTVFEQVQPNTLTANNLFNNAKGVARPVTHYNQYGVTAGGPLWIPKIFNGKNKVFWFFAFEGLKDSQPNPTFTTVPTDLERQGNFSQVLAADGVSTQLYDPYSGVVSGSTLTRTAYPNNVIPSSQLSPVAQKYLQFYPEPNIVPVRADGYQNFGSSATTNDKFNNELGRMDYNMSDRSRIFFDIRRTGYTQLKNDYFDNNAEGSLLYRNNWGGAIDEVFTVNATNVIDVRLNLTRMAETHSSPGVGIDPTTLGFPSYMTTHSEYVQLPIIGFSSNSNFQGLAYSGGSAVGNNNLPSQSWQLFGTWSSIKGNHSFKFGMDARQYRLNTFTVGNSTGTFSFSNNTWVRASSSASSTVVMGQDFSEFMLGLPTSGSYDLSTYGSWYSYYASPFVQDDWRIKRNLTVSWGVRYDWNGPYHEKWARTVNGFDTADANPLQAAAQAAYAKSPSPYLAASAFNVPGGLTFATSGNTAVYQNMSHIVSPRIGFAWTPDVLKGKTVIRGGAGVFASAVTISQMSLTGAYSTNPFLNQTGYSATTTLTAPTSTSTISSTTPTLSSPFPAGFTTPVGSASGMLTSVGGTAAFINPNMKTPYSMRWNFGFQHTLTSNTVLEVMYIGNHALHIPVSYTQLNTMPRQYLSTSGLRDSSTTYLTGTTTDPFNGLISSGTPSGSTIAIAQLLARFPEFPVGDGSGGWSGSGGVLEENNSVGSSYFHSLNIGVRRRLSKSLSLNVNYIKSRLIEYDSWLNDSDGRPERRVSPTDHPGRFVTTVSYNLPIHLQSHLMNSLIGGWTVNAVYQYQVGAPLMWANGSTTSPGDYVYLGAPLHLNNRQINGNAFDATAFVTNPANASGVPTYTSTLAFNYHLRTFPTTFNNLRQDGINQLDMSILKRFMIGESRRFELRGEFYNLPNHAVFAAPSETASSSGFGAITATSNLARSVQLVARLYW